MPNYGPHAIVRRDEAALLGTDKEHRLFEPQNESWTELAEELAEQGVSVDLFAASTQACDLATIGQ